MSADSTGPVKREGRRPSKEDALYCHIENLRATRARLAGAIRDLERQICAAQGEWLAEARKGGRGR